MAAARYPRAEVRPGREFGVYSGRGGAGADEAGAPKLNLHHRYIMLIKMLLPYLARARLPNSNGAGCGRAGAPAAPVLSAL